MSSHIALSKENPHNRNGEMYSYLVPGRRSMVHLGSRLHGNSNARHSCTEHWGPGPHAVATPYETQGGREFTPSVLRVLPTHQDLLQRRQDQHADSLSYNHNCLVPMKLKQWDLVTWLSYSVTFNGDLEHLARCVAKDVTSQHSALSPGPFVPS